METQLLAHLIEIRRLIHTNPELGYQEFQTSKLIMDELSKLSIPFETNIADTGTGIIATLTKGQGNAILLRADMDALPINEETELSFKSKVPNKMHACGHDLHTTMLLGAAHLLKEKDFPGTIKFLFQPSEEGNRNDPLAKRGEIKKSGGERISESDLLKELIAAIGLHVHPLLLVGKMAFCLGDALACTAFFDIEIIGVEGHAAFPEKAIDPIYIGSQFILAAQGIISRYTAPNGSKVISFTNIKTGIKDELSNVANPISAENVIPRSLTLSGTIRALDIDVYKNIKDKLQNISDGFKLSFGADIKIEYTLDYPSLLNDKKIHLKLKPTLDSVFEPENILEVKPLLGGEDFAFYSRKIPSMFYFLGANFEGRKEFLHDSRVVFNENCIPLGAEFLANAGVQLLNDLQ
jgi:amidohydrolase